MKTLSLLIMGCGGHARSVADIALHIGFKELLFVDHGARPGEQIFSFDVHKTFPTSLPMGCLVFPASGDNWQRMHQIQIAIENGFSLTNIVSPLAYLGAGVTVGEGTLLAHHAHVGPSAIIGKGGIINTGAVVEHECQIGDFSHISVNATIAGRCKIGKRVFIGAGAIVIDKVRIADDVVIGAGATVVEDLIESGVYVGTPASLVKNKSHVF
ncbi:transferase hexapeptide repeat containing protein [Desulforamulus reducens MI-1]|uniref:Transferase hexapeptide repeat containing protein n=1 Tax=Desulforamulus reducens (strain ATCC BAA-1160 / DSM 100696 / MI-1) TaxID=349161 RepID=A4J977_DESRM|nr:NeuD/PglB/VioB family sugar acetyltransferase [Desulforamulus reducens]ABO51630.1 transferase hexapeptide repeat containing protein [Desulforamulus reducens MI-1]